MRSLQRIAALAKHARAAHAVPATIKRDERNGGTKRAFAVLAAVFAMTLGLGAPAQAESVTAAPDASHQYCAATTDDLSKVRCFTSAKALKAAKAAETIYGEVLFDKFNGGQFYVWARNPCYTLNQGPVQDVNLATWDNNTASRGLMTALSGPNTCNRWMAWSLPGCGGTSLGWGSPGVWASAGINRMMCVRFWRA
ncbi:hypothetical protein ACWENQ_16435 [Nonomuraea sp. NPDC004354]